MKLVLFRGDGDKITNLRTKTGVPHTPARRKLFRRTVVRLVNEVTGDRGMECPFVTTVKMLKVKGHHIKVENYVDDGEKIEAADGRCTFAWKKNKITLALKYVE
jgi:hypothetical protein